MNDYVSGEGLSDEEVQTQLVLFAHGVHSDSTSFDEAVKEVKWRAAMDAEMKSIEKNGTWDLTESCQKKREKEESNGCTKQS